MVCGRSEEVEVRARERIRLEPLRSASESWTLEGQLLVVGLALVAIGAIGLRALT